MSLHLAGAQCAAARMARSSPAPVCPPRRHSHTSGRRRVPACPRVFDKLKGLLGKDATRELAVEEEEEEGGELKPIDTQSRVALDGSSQQAFGPMVRGLARAALWYAGRPGGAAPTAPPPPPPPPPPPHRPCCWWATCATSTRRCSSCCWTWRRTWSRWGGAARRGAARRRMCAAAPRHAGGGCAWRRAGRSRDGRPVCGGVQRPTAPHRPTATLRRRWSPAAVRCWTARWALRWRRRAWLTSRWVGAAALLAAAAAPHDSSGCSSRHACCLAPVRPAPAMLPPARRRAGRRAAAGAGHAARGGSVGHVRQRAGAGDRRLPGGG
jgi:hypothetical protein